MRDPPPMPHTHTRSIQSSSHPWIVIVCGIFFRSSLLCAHGGPSPQRLGVLLAVALLCAGGAVDAKKVGKPHKKLAGPLGPAGILVSTRFNCAFRTCFVYYFGVAQCRCLHPTQLFSREHHVVVFHIAFRFAGTCGIPPDSPDLLPPRCAAFCPTTALDVCSLDEHYEKGRYVALGPRWAGMGVGVGFGVTLNVCTAPRLPPGPMSSPP